MLLIYIWIFKLSPKDYVPKPTTYSISSLLASKMVLVMISLKPVKIGSFVFPSVYLMKCVVGAVIHQISAQHSEFEASIDGLIFKGKDIAINNIVQ